MSVQDIFEIHQSKMNSMLLSYREGEQNLSLYEDKLKFYFIASNEDENSMQFARDVSSVFLLQSIWIMCQTKQTYFCSFI